MAAKNNVITSLKKIPEYLIEQADKNLGDQITKIEKLKTDNFYRIYLKSLDYPSFLTTIPKGGQTYGVLLHYCDKNEKGVSCNHLSYGVAAGKRLGMDITHCSTKTLPNFIATKDKFDDKEYEILNAKDPFNDLLAIIEEDQEEETVAPAPVAPPTKSPSPATGSMKRNWKTGWTEVEDYLKGEGATNREIINIQQKRISVHAEVTFSETNIPPVKPDTPYIGPYIMRAIRWILSGKHLILVGEKGAGKDTLIATVAWVFGYPMTLVGGNGDEDKESLVDSPVFKNNESGFELRDFTKGVENGDLINFAEVNFLDGEVTGIFHTLLDKHKMIPSRARTVKQHPENLIIFSMNHGNGYSGIKEINEALGDRVVIMNLPYGDFKSIVKAESGYTEKKGLDFLEGIKNAVDKFVAVNDGEGKRSQTIRGHIDAAKFFKDFGLTFDTKLQAVEDCIINKTFDVEVRCALREAIRTKCWKDLPVSLEEELYITAGGL